MQRWRLTADGESSTGERRDGRHVRRAARRRSAATARTSEAADSSSARDAAVGRQGSPGAGRAGGRAGSRPAASAGELGANARGNRDKSWGPRRWGGPKMWRWFSINIDDDTHFGGIVIGTDGGDLHRGWVWRDGEPRVDRRVEGDERPRGRRHHAPAHSRHRDRQGRPHARARRRACSGSSRGSRASARHHDRQRGARPLDLRRSHRHRASASTSTSSTATREPVVPIT